MTEGGEEGEDGDSLDEQFLRGGEARERGENVDGEGGEFRGRDWMKAREKRHLP